MKFKKTLAVAAAVIMAFSLQMHIVIADADDSSPARSRLDLVTGLAEDSQTSAADTARSQWTFPDQGGGGSHTCSFISTFETFGSRNCTPGHTHCMVTTNIWQACPCGNARLVGSRTVSSSCLR